MKSIRMIITSLFLLLMCGSVQAQFGKRLGKAIENAAERTVIRKAEQKTEQAVSKGIDKATNPDTYKNEGENQEAQQPASTQGEQPATSGTSGSTSTGTSTTEAVPVADSPKAIEITSAKSDVVSGNEIITGVYFPSEEGMILEYADKNAKGKVTGFVQHQIQKIDKQDDANFSVTYLVSMSDDKHKEIISPMEVIVKVANGIVYFDGSSAMGKLVEDLQIKGNGITIPSNIKVGQKLEDFSVSIESISTTSSCTNVTVAAEESLTTDAGTFDTYRIDMDYSGKALFIQMQGSISQWFTKGIGEVRTINYDKNGKVSTTRELVKLTR